MSEQFKPDTQEEVLSKAEKDVELERLNRFKRIMRYFKEYESELNINSMVNASYELDKLKTFENNFFQKIHHELFPAIFVKEARALYEILNRENSAGDEENIIEHHLIKFTEELDKLNTEFHLLVAKFLVDITVAIENYRLIWLYEKMGDVEKFKLLEEEKKENEASRNNPEYWVEWEKRNKSPERINLLKEIVGRFLEDVSKLSKSDFNIETIANEMIDELNREIEKRKQ